MNSVSSPLVNGLVSFTRAQSLTSPQKAQAQANIGIDFSSLVPYTGATGNVDLASYFLTANKVFIGGSTGPQLDNSSGTIRARTNDGLADAPITASQFNWLALDTVSLRGRMMHNAAVGIDLQANEATNPLFRITYAGTEYPFSVSRSGVTVSGDATLSTLNSSKLRFGGAGTTYVTTQSTGLLIYETPYGGGSATHYFRENGTAYLQIAGGNLEIQGTRAYAFSSGGASTADIALYRLDANTLELNNRTAGTQRDLKLRALTASGAVKQGFTSLSSDPTTLDLVSGSASIYKNTTSGALKLWANDGGTMKSVTLV